MWNRKRKAKIKDLRQHTDQASEQLHSQKPKVNAMASWLDRRKNQNGFGVDFEYTLRPRGTR